MRGSLIVQSGIVIYFVMIGRLTSYLLLCLQDGGHLDL